MFICPYSKALKLIYTNTTATHNGIENIHSNKNFIAKNIIVITSLIWIYLQYHNIVFMITLLHFTYTRTQEYYDNLKKNKKRWKEIRNYDCDSAYGRISFDLTFEESKQTFQFHCKQQNLANRVGFIKSKIL